jgi:cathepsin L
MYNKAFIALAIVSLGAICLSTPLTHTKEYSAFLQYEFTYSPKFASAEERMRRFEIFKSNLVEIENLNKKYPSATFGVTKFATWTKEEFEQKMLIPKDMSLRSAKPPSDSHIEYEVTQEELDSAPTYFDWRQQKVVTSIKDQDSCGSCWAFASTAAIESQYAIHTRKLLNLSEQQLVDCEWVSQGCNFGFVNTAYDYVRDNGQFTYDSYPYQDEKTKCHKTSSDRVFIDGHRYVTANETAIAAYIAKYGPAAFAIICPEALMHYKGGILEVNDCLEQSTGLHAMVLIGYTQDYWIIKNQWGTTWGEHGFVRFKRGINMCDMALQVDAPYIN